MKNFDEFIKKIDDTELKNVWDEIIKKRREAKKYTITIISIVDIILLIFFITMTGVFRSGTFSTFLVPQLLFMTLVIDLIIWMIIYTFKTSKSGALYNQKYKEIVITKLLNEFVDDADYVPLKALDKEEYKEGFKEYFDRFTSDDYLEGSLEGKHKIKMAEVHTEVERTETDANGNTTTTYDTVFCGLYFKIRMNKAIPSNLYIAGYKKSIGFKGTKLKMDSSEFEKLFDVYTDNSIIAMQILTHDIMEILRDFKLKSKLCMDVYIKNDIIYIRFNTGRMFEAKISKKEIIDKKIVKRYFDIMNFVCTFDKMMLSIVEQTEI